MSRYYEMTFEITGYNPELKDDIYDAVDQEWELEQENVYASTLTLSGHSYLVGGESEEDFTVRVTHAVWDANKDFCRVTVIATYLEDPPCETHELVKADYEKYRANKEAEK